MSLRDLWFLLFLFAGRAAGQDTSRAAAAIGRSSPPLTPLEHHARFRDLEDVAKDSVRALRAALNEYYDRCTKLAGVGEPVVDAVGHEGEYWVVHVRVATEQEMLDGDMLVWVHKTSSDVGKVKRWCR